jgi:tRNA(Ile2) C34 agmatinyltransferase TiaS
VSEQVPFSQAEDRFLRHHRGDGIALVAQVMGRTCPELLNRAEELGIELAITPEFGEVCPRCGSRMTRWGSGYRHGLCEACWSRERALIISSLVNDQQGALEYNRARTERQRRG